MIKFKINKKRIEEATERELDLIGEFLLDYKPEDLALSNIFGDKTRIIQTTNLPDKSVVDFFQDHLKYDVNIDYDSNVVTWDELSVFDEEGKFKKKYVAEEPIFFDQQKRWAASFKMAHKKVNLKTFFKNIGKYAKDLNTEKLKLYFRPFYVEDKYSISKVNPMIEKWRSQPKNANYYIIYTRHPIDVFRMSDFESLTSCHSPPSQGGESSYFQCAVMDSLGRGAAFYLVKREDFERAKEEVGMSDLDNQEFLDQLDHSRVELFKDEFRNSKTLDLEPRSRGRIKQYHKKDGSIKLAGVVPTLYGDSFTGLTEQARNWVNSFQKDQIEALQQEIKNYGHRIKAVDLSQWEILGGTYQDFGADQIFKFNFNIDTRNRHDIGYADKKREREIRKRIPGYTDIDQILSDAKNLVEYYFGDDNFIEVIPNTVDEGGGDYSINVDARLNFSIDIEKIPPGKYSDLSLDSNYQKRLRLRTEWKEEIQSIASAYNKINSPSYKLSSFVDGPRVSTKDEKSSIEFSIHIKADSSPSLDAFRNFASEIYGDYQGHKEDIVNFFMESLAYNGFVEGTLFHKTVSILSKDNPLWEVEIEDRDTEDTSIEIENQSLYLNIDNILGNTPLDLRQEGDSDAELSVFFQDTRLGYLDKGQSGYVHFESTNSTIGSMETESLEQMEIYIRESIIQEFVFPETASRIGGWSDNVHKWLYDSLLKELARVLGVPINHLPASQIMGKLRDSNGDFAFRFIFVLDRASTEEELKSAIEIFKHIDDFILRIIIEDGIAAVLGAGNKAKDLKEVNQYFKKYSWG